MFRSTGISSYSPTAFCWLTSMHDPELRIRCPTNPLSCEGHIIPVFRANKEIKRKSLAGTRCSISVPPVPKRSSTKRLIIPATDFPAAGLPANGSSTFSHVASASVRTRGLFEMLLLSCHCVELFWFRVRSRDCIQCST